MAKRNGVRVEGDKALQRKLNRTSTEIQKAQPELTFEEAEALVRNMQAYAPERTGELKDSMRPIRLPKGGAAAEVTARHADFVEWGTSDTPAQPFARPAAERARKEWASDASNRMREALKKAGW